MKEKKEHHTLPEPFQKNRHQKIGRHPENEMNHLPAIDVQGGKPLVVRFKEAGTAYEGLPRNPPTSPRQFKERQSTRATGRSEGRGLMGFSVVLLRNLDSLQNPQNQTCRNKGWTVGYPRHLGESVPLR